MTVLIAGATGYLGRYLCAEYARRGRHVTALVRNPAWAVGIKRFGSHHLQDHFETLAADAANHSKGH
ncbi:NmrA family NAD(P)-binding protein [Marivivens sp. JLT3646]|uniref:NAD-dependent epimerase/dehydratase family protein n=1 Tax=Marivivens sp. JLT3646 TaxID=1920883 RepID=UPI0007FFB604|nr:NmrA family NAD(P)-binding protein [Marivivens sp. JLT3646]OBR39594.1 hypothetical protein A9199_01065 [Donghicola sp. JL3646]